MGHERTLRVVAFVPAFIFLYSVSESSSFSSAFVCNLIGLGMLLIK